MAQVGLEKCVCRGIYYRARLRGAAFLRDIRYESPPPPVAFWRRRYQIESHEVVGRSRCWVEVATEEAVAQGVIDNCGRRLVCCRARRGVAAFFRDIRC